MKVCIPFVAGIGDSAELKYVLRSHALYEPDWEPVLVGNEGTRLPSWYKGEIIRMEGNCAPQHVHKDQFKKIGVFCQTHPNQTFVYSPDDCFLLAPWPKEPRSMAKSPVFRGFHGEAWTNTLSCLSDSGVQTPPVDFQLHSPQYRDSGKWVEMLHRIPAGYGTERPVMHRTLYGNFFLREPSQPPPHPIWDRKVINFDKYPEDKWGFISTQDSMAMSAKFQTWVQKRFPKRSPYEKV